MKKKLKLMLKMPPIMIISLEHKCKGIESHLIAGVVKTRGSLALSCSPESKCINLRKLPETPMARSIITLGDIIFMVFVVR